ncbi:MAG: HAD family phosphatase [Odoribacter sp.]|nr:HAD family phosphatase [Odoribacter sp.]
MSLKAVLFDLDGVLIDTEGIYTDFWNAVDRRFPTGIEDFALKIKGSTLPSILERYFDPSTHDEILLMLREQEENMAYRLFDGAESLLKSLHDAGILTAIVTSSNRPKMDVVFSHLPALARYTSALVTDEDVTASKPDPQGYLIGASRLGVQPTECIVMEDSLAGLRAGLASGAKVVGLTTTNSTADVTPLAHAVFHSINDITLSDLLNM